MVTISRSNFICFMSALFFVLVIIIPSIGRTQVARTEIIPFQSVTLTDKQFLMGEKDGKSVTLAGLLNLPCSGNDRLLAVILLHGSGGMVGFINDWERDLNAMEVATFVIDWAFWAQYLYN